MKYVFIALMVAVVAYGVWKIFIEKVPNPPSSKRRSAWPGGNKP